MARIVSCWTLRTNRQLLSGNVSLIFIKLVCSSGTDPNGDEVGDRADEQVLLEAGPQLTLVKQGTVDATPAAPDDRIDAGDVVRYSYSVENTGNVRLAGPVTVNDDRVVLAFGLMLSAALGLLTFRSIVSPVCPLKASVEASYSIMSSPRR